MLNSERPSARAALRARTEPVLPSRFPAGYAVRRFDRGGTEVDAASGRAWREVIYLETLEEPVFEAGLDDPQAVLAGPYVEGWLEGGRTPHARVEFGSHSWVLKEYRRGGAVGAINAKKYWGRARFLRELEVSAAARAAGVATPETVALVIETVAWGACRAWLVSRFLAGVRPLHTFIGSADEVRLFVAAGEQVARAHRAGLEHADLHLGNILGRVRDHQAQTFLVDWDRARRDSSRARSASNGLASLVRLWRSVEKARRRGGFVARGGDSEATRTALATGRSAALGAFLRGYFRGEPQRLRRARAYFRKRAPWIALRRIFWGATGSF